MRARAAAFFAGLLAGSLPLAAPAQTSPAPVRTLVYAFESRKLASADGSANTAPKPVGEISPDDCGTGGMEMRRLPSDIGIGSGGMDWFQVDCGPGYGYQISATGQPERGTIQVLVERKQTDGSLVVQLSDGSPQPDASPATCVVSPTTALICDPNKPVSLQDVTLLRFLAPGFVDPARDQPRWQLEDQGPQSSFQATYTILQDAGPVVTIGERRTATGEAGPGSTAASSATILYDKARALPTAIDENLVQKTVRFGQHRTTQSVTLFRLQSPASR